ncbi:MAG TPA: urease accessory protein UreD [Xanthobacteraceae bacterium]|jgi:urease accessory protein|nr:urease accessory protein UreD [Xanthobacteraceae bacterium]
MSLAEDRAQVFAANRAVGRIELAAHYGRGITSRARLHESGGLRMHFPGARARARELEAVLINTAGGIAGGDRFDLDIAAGDGARLTVTSAAAEKVYRSLGPDATIRVKLTAGAGAAIAWLPQETILFDGARLDRTIDVELAPDARLIFAEAVVFGRIGMGETVAHGAIADRWRVRRGGALVYAETLRLDGAIAEKLGRAAIANRGAAIATVLIVPGSAETLEPLRALGSDLRGEVGTSAWNGIAVARLCAADGAALRHDLVALLTALRGRSLPRLWLN